MPREAEARDGRKADRRPTVHARCRMPREAEARDAQHAEGVRRAAAGRWADGESRRKADRRPTEDVGACASTRAFRDSTGERDAKELHVSLGNEYVQGIVGSNRCEAVDALISRSKDCLAIPRTPRAKH